MKKYIYNIKPVSTNQAYRKRQRGFGMYMTDEGTQFKEFVFYETIKQGKQKFFYKDTKLKMFIWLSWKHKYRRDIDNHVKLLIDSLQGILFEDDTQIDELWVKRQSLGIDRIMLGIEELKENETKNN